MNGKLISVATSGLTEYTIPDGVKMIGYSAFESGIDLERVTLPESVEQIANSFAKCKNLKEVYIKSDKLIKLDENNLPFDVCNLNLRIFVPNKKLNGYQKSKQWASYLNNIVGYDF